MFFRLCGEMYTTLRNLVKQTAVCQLDSLFAFNQCPCLHLINDIIPIANFVTPNIGKTKCANILKVGISISILLKSTFGFQILSFLWRCNVQTVSTCKQIYTVGRT